MQRFISFTAALVCLFIVSCKSQVINASGPQPTKEPTVYKGVTDNTCAVEMAFGSYGSGIERCCFLKKVTKLIEEWKLKSTAKTNWS